MREGWWCCVLWPQATYRMVKRQERTIDQLNDQTTRHAYELSWCHGEIADLHERLISLRAIVAGEDAYQDSVQAGEDHETACDSARRAYDLTLWLERSAREPWLKRKHEWVGGRLAQIERQQLEAEAGGD
jgi:hypothetical protein